MGPFLLLRSPRARALAGLAIAVCGLAAAAGLHFLDGALYLLPPLPRGGLLIASFLAVRPPPGAACLQG
jgi:hypothetical protein